MHVFPRGEVRISTCTGTSIIKHVTSRMVRLTGALIEYRFLQYDKSALQQYVQAETRYAEKWMQPLAALQRQLQIEMLQNSPDQQVHCRLFISTSCFIGRCL